MEESDFECPIHGIINSCEIEDAYFGRVLSIFWQKKKKKKYIMTFSEKKIFSNFVFPEKST